MKKIVTMATAAYQALERAVARSPSASSAEGRTDD
jgi:hypothetical protein